MKKQQYFLLLLGVILLVGSYLRLFGVFTNSFAFTYDVGRDMLAVQQLVYHHKIPLIGFTTGVEGIFYGPWWYYILSAPFALSGGNPQFIAFFMALTGIATIILIYLLGKKVSDPFLGIAFALMVAVSPLLINLSSQIWNPNTAPLLVVIALFVILKIFEKPTKTMFFLLGILSGLLIDTEIVFGLLLLTGTISGLLIVARRKLWTRQALLFIPGIVFIFLPRILFEMRHQFLMTNTVIRIATQTVKGENTPSLPLLAKESIFFNQFADSLTSSLVIFALIFLVILVIGFILVHRKMQKKEQQLFIFSLTVIIVFLFGISLFKHDIWPHYLVGLPIFYIITAGIILNLLRKFIKYGVVLFTGVLIILFCINVKPIDVIASMGRPIWEGDAAVYRNQVAVVDFVYHQAHDQPFTYIVYTPPIFDYTYQYLFSWYGPKAYHYAPSTKTEKQFFVIIEPDFQHPEFLAQWLKLREKDGTILEQQKVKGGILVQTREHK